MSEVRFNCNNCGQHLSGDSSYAGQRVTCPACNAQVVVPPALPGATSAPGGPPFAGARPQAAPPLAQRTSGLAIASLVCSVGSFLIIPFGFIPGIICGHMARKQLATTPGLQGQVLARAGLIVGYLSLSFYVLIACAVAVVLFFAPRNVRTVSRPRPPIRTYQPQRVAPAEVETTDTQPDGSGWTMQLANAEVPAEPVKGRIHGQPFKLDKVSLDNGSWLKFAQGKDFFADREMDVVLFENDPAKLSGRTFVVPNKEFGLKPHIWMKWKEEGASVPKQRSFTSNYAMRLEFGELAGDKLPGKIYLCVPDQEKSFILGTFEVQVKLGKQ